ncbi:Arginase/deacetylase [Pseudovirgaria hyperparasitica]|uniref:Arginase/deacetylase n=1 Tax=Pseudovirgaria hyperparasitica TaxID=470096 RepID=A0A6A6VXR6_9PEZI|nr:Arginase/deacetylase [Pseudovirgaria hyperparasitica]KAF2755402.1 Arginase/deacetylase [Pseudovirgaria hyperparasitica]
MLVSLLSLAGFAIARDITFAPVYAYDSQNPIHVDTPGLSADVTTAKFVGLSTFANLPYVHCLAGKGVEVEKYDIAIIGAPFDTGVTSRPGARFGPRGIRQGSTRIDPGSAWDVYTGDNVFQSWARIVDCGDAPLTYLDNTVALKQLDAAHKIVSGRETNSSQYTTARIITLGGDHTTTLSALRSAHNHWGPVSVIHFDSHLDTWDPDVLGGGISHYAGVNHGTFLHIAHEEGLIRNTSAHAGLRAPMSSPKGDLKNDRRCGFAIVTARDIDRIGIQGVIETLKARVGSTNVYISVDIDVLDPAFAPATGTSEVGGWTTRELLSILDGLAELNIIGADVVEVAPIYDNPGETTVLAAAEIVRSLIALMVYNPVKTLSTV